MTDSSRLDKLLGCGIGGSPPRSGQVAERLNAPVSKTGIPARVSRVRISPCPFFRAAVAYRDGGFVFCWRVCFLVFGIGQVAERLKAHAWKACKRESVSRVRIPLCPWEAKHLRQLRRRYKDAEAGPPACDRSRPRRDSASNRQHPAPERRTIERTAGYDADAAAGCRCGPSWISIEGHRCADLLSCSQLLGQWGF